MDYIQAIRNFEPINEQEENDKKLILDFIEKNDDVLYRENEYAHVTSSGLIFNDTLDKILMVHHNIYNTWSWTGGHADGDSDLLSVAIKEAKEETSVENIEVLDENIIALDILPVVPHIKKGKFVSGHLHFCISYALVADENSHIQAKTDENSGVKWIKIDELEQYSNEPYLIGVYRKIHKRVFMNREKQQIK
ncbi:NUDIX hydrolase [Intestinibacter sp.]